LFWHTQRVSFFSSVLHFVIELGVEVIGNSLIIFIHSAMLDKEN